MKKLTEILQETGGAIQVLTYVVVTLTMLAVAIKNLFTALWP